MSVSESHRSRAGWPLVGVAVVTATACVTLGMLGQSKISAVESPDAATRADQLVEARNTLELGTLEVVTLRMLNDIGIEGDRDARLADAADRVRSAADVVEELASGSDASATQARAFVEQADFDALRSATDGDLGRLFDVAEDHARWAGLPDEARTQRDVVHQLSFVNALPLHVMVEGVAADASVNSRSITPESAIFFDRVTAVVRSDGGWFGVDPESPLDDSEWIEIDDAWEWFPEETELVSDTIAESGLIDYDAWMRDLGDADTAPPFALADILIEADALQRELTPTIDRLFVETQADRLVSVAEAESQRNNFLMFAAVLGLISLASGIAGIARIRRYSKAARSLAELATSDALTGIGNRHELEERTRRLSLDPKFDQHFVAIIDLDNFKMVNDVYGHAAGDAVLVEIATRLAQVADDEKANVPAAATSVVRLGGDEFLLTVHADSNWNHAAVRAGLDEIRNSSIDYEGNHIQLGFSVGVVLSEEPQDLSDLMRSADLAVYDDKADRARARQAAAQPNSNNPHPHTRPA